MNFPEARPIGEILMQLGDNDSNLVSTGDDNQVLSGASLNDKDDFDTTAQSLAESERNYGQKMNQVKVDEKFYEMHGNKYENLLSDSSHITMAELEAA